MSDIEFHYLRYFGDRRDILVMQSVACVDDEPQTVSVFRRVDDSLQFGFLPITLCIRIRAGV